MLALSATTALAQAGPQGPQAPRQPRSGVSIGGIGFSLSLGGGSKVANEPPLMEPPLEMRDAAIADALPDEIIFVIAAGATGADRIARAAKVVVIETAPLAEAGLVMVVAKLGPSDSVPAAQARLEKLKGVEWA